LTFQPSSGHLQGTSIISPLTPAAIYRPIPAVHSAVTAVSVMSPRRVSYIVQSVLCSFAATLICCLHSTIAAVLPT